MSHENVDNTNIRWESFRRKLFMAMLIAVFVIVVFLVWFFFISESNNDVILPPNISPLPPNP